MKKILIFTTALLMGMSSWAAERDLNFIDGWDASFNAATKTITFTGAYGGYGDTGNSSWDGLGDLTGWVEAVVEYEPTTVPIKITVEYGDGKLEGIASPPGATSATIPLGVSGSITQVNYIVVQLNSTTLGSVTINRFYITDNASVEIPDPGNGDLTFESDVIGNAYNAPLPWENTGAYAFIVANPAPNAINSSSKVLKLDVLDASADGYSQVVKFPNTSLATGKTWKDVEAVEFKALVPVGGYNIHFGAGMPGSGFEGISYGGFDGDVPNVLPNFWVEDGYSHYSDGSGWIEFSIGYDPAVNNTSSEVLNAGAVDFYLGLNTADATIYFDDITFVYKAAEPVAPTISGLPAMTLTDGYASAYTSAYTITGTEPVTVSITSSSPSQITWNSAAKRLDIAAGIAPGVYVVVLTATNGIAPNATHTFTLTVNAVAPTITGPTQSSLVVGYAATSTGVYTIGGSQPVNVSITSSDAAEITWNNATKRLDIAAGITSGEYVVVLTATNGTAPNATWTFTLTVTESALAPTINGPTALSLEADYAATSTGAYTIGGTEPVDVSITSTDASQITWNNDTKQLDIATGIQPGVYVVVLTATNGTAPDATWTFTLTVTERTGCSEIQTNPLKAWVLNGQLYVTGLIAGETLSIYGINGVIIYQSVVASNEVNISLPAQGVYIVRSGYNTIKVAF